MSDRDFGKCQSAACIRKPSWLSDWLTDSVEGPAGTTLAWCNRHKEEAEEYSRNWRLMPKLATEKDFWQELESP